MNALFKRDYERFTPCKYNLFAFHIRYMRNHELRFLYLGRKYQLAKSTLSKKLILGRLNGYRKKYGLEITFNDVGEGLRLVHPWDITVNTKAVIGKNVTLYKGCTIGSIDSGLKKGCPTICDGVTIYANATCCGAITIGSNSEIAAGAFVNFDVPPNSVVIGNPGVIHQKKANNI